MKHVMLSLTGLLLSLALLLAGCQDQSCTLETTLESGQTLQFSGCPVTEQTTEYRLTKDAATAETARLFVAEGRPTLSLQGRKRRTLPSGLPSRWRTDTAFTSRTPSCRNWTTAPRRTATR